MKAIKIDVVTQIISEIDISKGLQAIYRHLKCELFTCIGLPEKDALYIDDEGLFVEEPLGAFMIMGIAHPLSGNGLIIGCDDEGESTDCKITIEQAKQMVTFVDVKMLKGVPLESKFIPLSEKEWDEYHNSGNLPIGKRPVSPQ